MLPVILGGVAFATAGKLIIDEDFRDDVRDKVEDVLIKGYRGIEWLEEKMGLYEGTFSEETSAILIPLLYGERMKLKDLLEYKQSIRDYLEEKYNLSICAKDEVQGASIDDVYQLDNQMLMNIKNYQYFIKIIFDKIVNIKENNSKEDLSIYTKILKKFFITKVIKDSKLNKKSNEIILEAMKILDK